MSQQISDEELGRQVLAAIRRQQLTETGWFPFARLAGWWADAGYGSGYAAGVQYAVTSGWLEQHEQHPHVRISDVGKTI